MEREAVAPSVSAAKVAGTVAVGIAGRMGDEGAVVVKVGVVTRSSEVSIDSDWSREAEANEGEEEDSVELHWGTC